LKILFLSFYYYPDLCAGSFRTTAVVKSLKSKLKSDDHLCVMTTLPNRYKNYSVDTQEYVKDGNIEIYRFPIRQHSSGFFDQSLSFISYARNVLKEIKSDNPDVIVATTSRLMTGVLGAYISARKRSKYFLDIRDIFSETISEIFSKKNKFLSFILNRIFTRLEKLIIQRADKINVVSEGFIDYFIEKGFDTSKWLFLPNGIDKEFIGIGDTRDFSLHRTSNRIKVVYAGNIGEGQGLHKILPQCADKLRETHDFIIIGDGGCKQKLIEKIKILNISNIKVLNPVKRDELIELYKNADILFLHLNNYKAFFRVLPSKIFEYISIGKSVVAGVDGYPSKFLANNAPHAQVFTPCNIDGCISALLHATEIKISKQVIQDFVKNFNRETIADNMAEEIYAMNTDSEYQVC
jgi:hypothetical protein